MRPINGRSALLLALLSQPAFAAMQTDAFYTQIESHNENRSFWQSIGDALRGHPRKGGDLVVSVYDTDGHPLAGASVLAGQAAGVPFAGNQAVTDASGTVAFTAPELRGQKVSVTASLDGFTTASLIDNVNDHVTLTLQRNADDRGSGWVRGHLNGLPKLGSGSLELGFFVPASRPENLLNFDIGSFVSSYTVKVNIYGDRDIPGNVVLPTQTKFYGFIPINISKPDFVMPLPTSTYAHMAGIGGGISISDAVSLVQKKDYISLVNLFQLTNVGWTRDRVQVHGNENFDVNVNHVVSPNQVTAQFSGIQGLDAVAISLLDPAGDKGDYVAMDMKALKSESQQNGGGSLSLGQIRNWRALENSYVVAALLDKTQIQNDNSRWVVISIKPAAASVVPFTKFFSPIKPQGVGQNNREFRFTSPTASGLEPTLMLINVVSNKNTNDETKGIIRTVLWSAVLPGNADHVVLPDLGRAVLPAPDTAHGEKFHWEITAIRAKEGHVGVDLQQSIRELQDVSTLIQAF